MKLSALELMDLSDKLDELMSKASGATGLVLLDISDEIDQVMQQMGYGAGTDTKPEDPKPSDNVPQLVADFLADKFLKQSRMPLSARSRILASTLMFILTWTR